MTQELLKEITEAVKEIENRGYFYLVDVHSPVLKKEAYDTMKDNLYVCPFCSNHGTLERSFYGSVEVISFISDSGELKEAFELNIYCQTCLTFVAGHIIPVQDIYRKLVKEKPEKIKDVVKKITM